MSQRWNGNRHLPSSPLPGLLECSPLKLGLRHPEICLKETSAVLFCFLAVLSLGSFKSVLRVRKDTERRRVEWVRAQASPVPRGACALRGRRRGGGARWEGQTAPGWHRSDLLFPGLGRWGGVGSCLPQRLPGVVQHGGVTGLGHHLQEGLISAWCSGTSPPARPAAAPVSGCSCGHGLPGGEAAQGGSAVAPSFPKPWATRRAWKGKGSPKSWRRQ